MPANKNDVKIKGQISLDGTMCDLSAKIESETLRISGFFYRHQVKLSACFDPVKKKLTYFMSGKKYLCVENLKSDIYDDIVQMAKNYHIDIYSHAVNAFGSGCMSWEYKGNSAKIDVDPSEDRPFCVKDPVKLHDDKFYTESQLRTCHSSYEEARDYLLKKVTDFFSSWWRDMFGECFNSVEQLFTENVCHKCNNALKNFNVEVKSVYVMNNGELKQEDLNQSYYCPDCDNFITDDKDVATRILKYNWGL